ncbi:MAG: MFS transporter [Acidimicrobiia bacterium]|nr:MFS transporter [Acidimicrobiia bacterium]
MVVLACCAAALGSLDTSLNIAFPDLAGSFGLAVSDLQWVVIAYVLTYASLLLGFGQAADAFGHLRVLRAGLVVSTLAFAATGAAPTYALLAAARVLQGVGIALVLAAAPALVTLASPPERRGQALGMFQASVGAGLASGPLAGGLLVDLWGWRAVFLFRLPLTALLAALALGAVRDLGAATAGPRERSGWRERVDARGALTLAGALAAALLAASLGRTTGWLTPAVLGSAALAVTLGAAFLAIERRAGSPVVDLSLFRVRAFAVANALNVVVNAAAFTTWLLVPFYALDVLGLSTIAGSLLLALPSVCTAAVAPLAGRLSDRVGTAPVASAGLAVLAAGLALIARLGGSTPAWLAVAALAVAALGLGLFQVPNQSYVMGAIPRSAQGVAGAMSQMMRTVGIVSGVAAASAVFAARQAVHTRGGSAATAAFVGGFRDTFLVAAAVVTAALAVSLVRPKRAPDGP